MAVQDEIEKLVELAQEGDEEAFGQLVVVTETRIVGFLRRMGFQDADAEDLAGDVYLLAWKKLRKIEQPGKLVNWLLKLAARTGMKRLQKRLRENAQLASYARSKAAGPVWISETDPGYTLSDLLVGLSPQGRKVLAMKYIEDLSIDEIAAKSGMSFAQVDYLLGQAREVLRVRAWSLGLRPPRKR